jgi:hypothetical protein
MCYLSCDANNIDNDIAFSPCFLVQTLAAVLPLPIGMLSFRDSPMLSHKTFHWRGDNANPCINNNDSDNSNGIVDK